MSILPLSHHNQPASLSPPPPSLLPSALPEPSISAPAHEIPSENFEAPHAITRSAHIEDPASIPHFTPFFTLLSNTASSTTHHPSVSYIFSDDIPDNDPITAAALEILDPASSLPSPHRNSEHGHSDRRERYILLDMDATGSKVVSAQSLSPDWAVTSTELAPAPTWDDRGGEGVQGEVEGRGLMLRIEGMEALGSLEGGRGEAREKVEQKRLEELMEIYESRMRDLRRVVDAGAAVGITSGRNT